MLRLFRSLTQSEQPTLSVPGGWCLAIVLIHCGVAAAMAEEAAPQRLDPAAWGSDHVGQPVPDYITGEECLFCHRDIGPAWPKNQHQLTIRPIEPESDAVVRSLERNQDTSTFAAQVEFLLGFDRQVRLLKRSNEYGRLELLSTAYVANDGVGRLLNSAHPSWDPTTFADKCAGCHTTGVDAKKKTFSAISLDCFTCHGNVSLEHTEKTAHVLLSENNREARQVVSICGQCHLRGGKSRSTQSPYPHNFVAGDNLFRDFDVDWSNNKLQELNPGDKHIFMNASDVALFGKHELTCLSCHDVHAQSTEKHQGLTKTAICNACHVPGQSQSATRSYRAHSEICGY